MIYIKKLDNKILNSFYSNIKQHIYKVLLNAEKIISNYNLNSDEIYELKLRIKNHDIDKFELQYSQLLNSYNNIQNKIKTSIKEKEKIKYILYQHRKNNKHHIEYYNNINDMKLLDLIEFICDLHASYNHLYIIKYIKKAEFNNSNKKMLMELSDILL